MISQKHRFKGHGSVQKVRSRPVRGPGFSVFMQSTQKPWRAAVIVSKKVHKSAVVRNRIRRRVYEALRLYDKDGPIPSVDIVIVVHDSSLQSGDFGALQKAFRKALDTSLHFNS